MNDNFVTKETLESEDAILSKILENVSISEEYEQIKLPSLGGLYGLGTDTIHIRGLTFEDEKILAGLKDRRKSANILLERCIKEDLNPLDLIPQDKVFILTHIRNMSVGPNHEFSMTCPNCKEQSTIEINVLETFECRYPDKPLAPTEEIILGRLQKPVVVRRAKSHELENTKNNILENLWRYVVSIDGFTAAPIRTKVVDKLPREDIKQIISIVSSEGIGLDTRFMYACNSCDHQELTEFTFQNGFFTMT